MDQKKVRRHRPETIGRIERAVLNYRLGKTLKEIGSLMDTTKEGVRQLLGYAIDLNIMTAAEYDLLKNSGHVKKCHDYFVELLENIEYINQDYWVELRKMYWKDSYTRAKNAEKKCLDELTKNNEENFLVKSTLDCLTKYDVKLSKLEFLADQYVKGDYPPEVKMVRYALQHFKIRRLSLAQLFRLAKEYVTTKITLGELAKKHLICENANPASDAMLELRYAIKLGIISQEECREKGRNTQVAAWEQNGVRNRKYSVEAMNAILEEHDRTGVKYRKLARRDGVSFRALYAHKKRLSESQQFVNRVD